METSLFLITIHETGFSVPKMLWWYQIWHDVNKTWALVKFVKANVVLFNRECSMINDMMSSALNALFLISSFCQHNLWKMRIKNCFTKRLFTMHPSNGEFILCTKYGCRCDWFVWKYIEHSSDNESFVCCSKKCKHSPTNSQPRQHLEMLNIAIIQWCSDIRISISIQCLDAL